MLPTLLLGRSVFQALPSNAPVQIEVGYRSEKTLKNSGCDTNTRVDSKTGGRVAQFENSTIKKLKTRSFWQ